MTNRHKPQTREPEGASSRPQGEARAENRDTKGRFVKGQSGNPGGTPKAIHEQLLHLRKMATEAAPRAMELAISWLDSEDPDLQKVALHHVLTRSMGKESGPRELPVEAPVAGDVDTTPGGLLTLATKALGHVLSHWTARAAAGQLSDADAERLTDAVRTLAVLAKEDRQQRTEGEEGSLTLEELAEVMMAKLPPEKRNAVLWKFVGAPASHTASGLPPSPQPSGPAAPVVAVLVEEAQPASPQQPQAGSSDEDESFY